MSFYNTSLRKVLASVLVIGLGVLIIYALSPYSQAFFGAILLSIIFFPVYNYLEKKTGMKRTSSIIVVFFSIILILLPFTILTPLVYKEINNFLLNQDIINMVGNSLNNHIPFLDLSDSMPDITKNVAQLIRWLFGSFISSATNMMLNIVIAFFTMFYILINWDDLKKLLQEIVPFKKSNTKELIENFRTITRSTLISTVLIALFQSILLAFSFYLLGIKGFILWGVVSFILALFPVVGIPLIWIPASIILFINGSITKSIIIFIVGLVLSNIDIFVRSWLQEKFGKIHPLITLLGVILGIPLFGMLGLFIGPLLLSYFLLIAKMYKEEYL